MFYMYVHTERTEDIDTDPTGLPPCGLKNKIPYYQCTVVCTTEHECTLFMYVRVDKKRRPARIEQMLSFLRFGSTQATTPQQRQSGSFTIIMLIFRSSCKCTHTVKFAALPYLFKYLKLYAIFVITTTVIINTDLFVWPFDTCPISYHWLVT